MKKLILLALLVWGADGLFAQSADGIIYNGQLPTLQVGIVPYSEYLKQHAADIQRSKHSRAQVYKMISYFTANNYGEWEPYDSGIFTYTTAGLLTRADTLGFYDDDSLRMRNRQRHTYTYNSNDDIVLEVYESWRDTTKKPMSRLAKTYNAAHAVLTDTVMVWNAGSKMWVNHTLRTYTYNGSNKKTSELKQAWNGSAWVNVTKTTYTYDGGGTNLVMQVDQEWNTGNSSWDNVEQLTITRNGSGDVTEQVNQEWLNGAWVNDVKYLQIYDGNRNRTVFIIQDWKNNAWVNSQKNEWVYTANKATQQLGYFWDIPGSQWVKGSKNTFAYNGAGLMTEFIQAFWKADSNAYVNYSKDVFGFDNNNRRDTSFFYRWLAGEFQFSSQHVYLYDANGNLVKEISQSPGPGSTLEDDKQWNYYYARFEVAEIEDLKNELSASVFPNPSNTHATVSFSLKETTGIGINIYDVQGRVISTETIPVGNGINQIQLPLAEMPAGIYYIQLVGGEGSSSVLKFVRQ